MADSVRLPGPQGPLPGPLVQLQQHGLLGQQGGPPLQQQQRGPPLQQQQHGPPLQQQQRGLPLQQQQCGPPPQQQQHGQQDQHGLQKQLKHGNLNQLPKNMGSMPPKSTVKRDIKLEGPFNEEEKTLSEAQWTQALVS